MRRVFYYIILIVMLAGCSNNSPIVTKREYIKTKCPTFDYKLRVEILDLNQTHGAISWSDVSRIESMIEAKNNFNKNIKKLNN